MWLHSRIILCNKTIAMAMLLALAVFGAGIAGAETLYELGDRVEVETDGGIDEHVIAIASETITPATRDLRFELSNGAVATATMTSAEAISISGDVIWRGAVDGPGGHRVTLSRMGSTVAGYFESEIGPHLIQPTAKGHRLVWIDPSLYGECATHVAPAQTPSGGSTFAPDYSGSDYQLDLGDAELIYVDVLGLYTASARQQAGSTSAIEARLRIAVEVGNTALIDSESRMRFRLVHSALFELDDSGDSFVDLANLEASEQVATLRDEVSADLVGLLVADLEFDTCGRAEAVLSDPKGDSTIAHQVTKASCATGRFAFAHELGHLVGMDHDPDHGPDRSQALYPWAFGHIDPMVEFHTIMSYQGDCSACQLIGHFSNPDVSHVSPTGVPEERDNARTADLIAPVVAAYRIIDPMPALPIGEMDVADCSEIQGWAWDPDDFARSIRVRIVHDGNVLATVVADEFRPELPLPRRNHGFRLATPAELVTGEAETIRAYALDVDEQGQETGAQVELQMSPATLVCGSTRAFIASYIPYEGGPRTELALTMPSSPLFNFHYSQWLGNFEQRPGGACHQGQNNPTYLKVRYEGPDIVSCSYQASWDSGPNTCSAGIIGYLNAQNEFVVNTDRVATDPDNNCGGYDPPIIHLPFNQPAWLQLDFTTTEGTSHSRRLNFLKFREIPIPD